ncbi:MAG: arylsulfatase [Phycisphaerae bacterium]|nr:arylsulfatase [Phycisphaerae bacterium]
MLSRRRFLQVSGLFSLSLLGAGCSMASKKPKPARPNIILILADDLGWSDIGCYGSEIATPNLDKLAEGGIRFRQFHNTAKCMPSRACLLTGVYAQQCGMMKPAKIINAVTLGEVLKPAGYRTLAVGKHHSTENLHERGFDRYYGLRDGCCNYFNPGKQRPGEGKPAQKRPDRAWCIEDQTFEPYTPKDKDFYTTDYFTKYAVKYLDDYKDEQKPFFMYVAYTAPHDPLMAWPEDIAKYEDTYNVGYEKIRAARYNKQLKLGLVDEKHYPLSEPTHKPWDSLSDKEKTEQSRTMAVYAAMIDRMDQGIGKIIDKLKAIGKADSTLIMFAADNGASAEMVRIGGTGEIGSMTRWTSLGSDWANIGNTPLRYFKNYSYQGGICTPLIANFPGVTKAGSFCDFPGHFIDFMPTIMELTGAKYPATFDGSVITPLQGESFADAIKGKQIKRTKPIFWQWSKGKAVRQGKWKLVKWANEDWNLFNMDEDKSEIHNLANKMPEKAREMQALYEDWVKSLI